MDPNYLQLISKQAGVDPELKEPVKTGIHFKDMADEKTPFYHASTSTTDRCLRIFLKYVRPAFAEMTGSFSYVWVGTLAYAYGGPLWAAIAYGVTLTFLVATFAGISGSHINPAITLGVIIAGECELLQGFVYVLAQLVGGIIGAGLAQMSLTAAENNGTTLYDLSNRGVVRLPNGMGDLIGVVIVATMTCLLVLTFIMTAIEQGTPISSVAIGFAVFGVTMAGNGLITNPAQEFGTAVVANLWSDQWIFWVGPLLGALAAGALYRFIFASSDKRLFLKDKYQ
ncbi:hypothetical protein CAPTEDRAFT_219373 [Capitella teleta]|uniref:Aquaporin n=1 Tax=Capitella teleta TaxID=283909 RepID=R7TFN3_CAPTE|nr:hypothetical protein CAPTEDRAFT_219373 [Capitella teleta]|eukprot:ELT92559.1 hypothetical protein CAPTEDRAFT_219373 [Capitella teleta]